MSGCVFVGTLSTSENGRLSLIKTGIWEIAESELLNLDYSSFSFLDNKNIYIWKGNGKEIVGFNQKGKKIFDTTPNKFYTHNFVNYNTDRSSLHLFSNEKIIGEIYTDNKDFRMTTDFLIFDKDGKIVQMEKWDFKEKKKFYPRGYNVHNLPDSMCIVSGHGWIGEQQLLFAKYKYPETEFINIGGAIGPGYDGGGMFWCYSKSIIIDSSLFYIVATSPFIRELNLNLEFVGNKGVQGEHYHLGSFEKNPNFGYWDFDRDNESYQEWMLRNSRTIDLFQHRIYSCVLYREVLESGDKFWCQVYSRDLEKYFGEIQLPEIPIGRDSKYIYFRDLRKNEPRILKTEIRVN